MDEMRRNELIAQYADGHRVVVAAVEHNPDSSTPPRSAATPIAPPASSRHTRPTCSSAGTGAAATCGRSGERSPPAVTPAPMGRSCGRAAGGPVGRRPHSAPGGGVAADATRRAHRATGNRHRPTARAPPGQRGRHHTLGPLRRPDPRAWRRGSGGPADPLAGERGAEWPPRTHRLRGQVAPGSRGGAWA